MSVEQQIKINCNEKDNMFLNHSIDQNNVAIFFDRTYQSLNVNALYSLNALYPFLQI